MRKLAQIIYLLFIKIKNITRRIFIEPIIKLSFGACGKKVRVGRRCSFSGKQNIFVGKCVSIGEETRILTTRARVIIKDFVMFHMVFL